MTALPHDSDAEAALVGWCMVVPAEAWRVLDRVTAAEFYRPSWAACIDALRSSFLTPADLADRTGTDPADLVSATAVAPMRHQVDGLVERVTDLAGRRRMIVAASEAMQAASDLTSDPSAAVDVLRSVVDDMDLPGESPVVEVDEFLAQADDPYDWVIPNLIERGDRLLLTAGEGVGKSTMLRQIAVAVSAGIHPWRLSQMEPKRVLLVDVENLERKVRREIRPLLELVGRDYNPGNLGIEVRVGGMDLSRASDQRWLGSKVSAFRPDLLVIGPLYQLHGAPDKGDQGGEDNARRLSRTLDRLRERYGCALIMETHAPHGSMGTRDLRPFGSSLWMRWPEFGVGLRRNRELGDRAFELIHWRGPRDKRDWPAKFEQNSSRGWPWIATYKTAGHRDEEQW